MGEVLEDLTQIQLGKRKVIADSFKETLLKEVQNVTEYVSDIDLKIKTGSKIATIDIETASDEELEELKSLYSKTMMRIRSIEMKYSMELKKIDKIIIEKR